MPRPRKIDQLDGAHDDTCLERVVHIDEVLAARASMPTRQAVATASALYAAIADPTRLRIVAALRNGELCVCDIAAVVGQSESAISHQLRHLREQRIVRDRRDGRRRYYSLDDEHVRSLLDLAISHVEHTTPADEGTQG